MPEATYEILALLMRYVFTALAALICLRAYRWLLREHRLHVKERRQLPRAGQIGVLEMADTGERLPIAAEGLVGSGRSCDVVIRKRGLRSRHFTFRLQPRKGVEIIPCRGARVSVNGQKAQAGRYALSGSLIEAGDVMFRLRLLKRLRLPEGEESPQPMLNSWDEDEFLPNGVAVPAPGQYEEPEEDMDDIPGDYGKVLPFPGFGDQPPEGGDE